MPRTLIYIPMMHRDNECAVFYPRHTAKGKKQFQKREDVAMELWLDVIGDIDDLLTALDGPPFHIFMEGWISSNEAYPLLRRAKYLMHHFHGVYTCLAFLLSWGGVPHATENRLLRTLTEKAEDRWNALAHDFIKEPPAHNALMVEKRDRYIAQRLECTVQDGELAFLCIGSGHDVPRYLDASWDITVLTHPKIYALTQSLGRKNLRWMQIYQEWAIEFLRMRQRERESETPQ